MDRLIEEGVKVDAIITDPPYKVISGGRPIHEGQPSGILSKNDGKIFKHNDIDAYEWISRCYNILKDNTHAYFMVNTLNMEHYLSISREVGFKLHNILVWEKNNCTPSRWYMKNAEYILFLRKGKAKPIKNGGDKTLHKFNNIIGNKLHPTEKPVELMKYYILNSSDETQLILDPFMGSGTTGVACKNTGRDFIGIELDKTYFDIAEKRILGV